MSDLGLVLRRPIYEKGQLPGLKEASRSGNWTRVDNGRERHGSV
jgi:hypothetical protein